jgi:hypothetical protein
MKQGSFSLRSASIAGLAVVGLLASGCGDRQSKAVDQRRLEGRWQSQDGRSEIAFGNDGTYRRLHGAKLEVGQWAIEERTLELRPKTATLATGEEVDIEGLEPFPTYQVVSLDADRLQLDPGNGQTETYLELLEPKSKKR